MPRHAEPLPDVWRVNTSDPQLISCTICEPQLPKKTWIARRSRVAHENTAFHRSSLEWRKVEDQQKRQREIETAEQAASSQPLDLGTSRVFGPQLPEYHNVQLISEATLAPEPDMDLDDGVRPLSGAEEDQFIRDYLDEMLGRTDDSFDGEDTDIELDIEHEDYLADPHPVLSDWDKTSENWYPYPSKTMFLVDVLDNLPRLHLSRQQLELILWVMRECGAANVPTVNQLRTMQKKLHKEVQGISSSRVCSSLGNIFYVNDVRELIAREFASPHTAPLLEYYPVKPSIVFSETWHGDKIHKLDPSLLTPMARQGIKDYYVKELAQLVDSRFVIPIRWVKIEGQLYANAWHVRRTLSGLDVDTTGVSDIPLSQFALNWLELEGDFGSHWTDQSMMFRQQMPNTLRVIAKNEELYTVFINVWADDVSGNVSKQMNAHKNLYMTNASLPGRLLQQEFHVKFISTSQHASTAEQMGAIRDMVNATNKEPSRVYNTFLRRHVRFRIVVANLPCDNPQGSEECSHIGPQGNSKCRKCKVGGSAKEVEKDDVYHGLHMVGEMRTVEDTLSSVRLQLDLAAEGVAQRIKDEQTRSGIKDKVAQGWIIKSIKKNHELHRSDPGLSSVEIKAKVHEWVNQQTSEPFNPLLDFPGVDPHRDTPVELLHTMLLGIVKYFWHNQNQLWKDPDRDKLVLHLGALNSDSLGISAIPSKYMVQYRNNLIGKHFRIIMQVLIFACHSIIGPDHLSLLSSIGKLGAMLWMPEVSDLESYLFDLNICIDNVLDAFDQIDPSRIIDKQKMHVLVHAPDDIRLHGPLIRSETETFECYNHVFRLCSILSNRQAPSKDIAMKFGKMECTKHILLGGYWVVNDNHAVCAGPGILDIFDRKDALSQQLGWTRHDIQSPGTLKTRRKRPPVATWLVWTDTQFTLPPNFHVDPTSLWCEFETVVATSQDICKVDSWVCFSNHQDEILLGQIIHLLGDIEDPQHRAVLIKCFHILDTLHQVYQVPMVREVEGNSKMVISPQAILFLVNVQHDCYTSQCEATITRAITQEREVTHNSVCVTQHKDSSQYVLNMYALHNNHRLHSIPKLHDLLRPQPIHRDRRQFHEQMVSRVREKNNARRVKSAARKKVISSQPSAKHSSRRKRARRDPPESQGMVASDTENEEAGEVIIAPSDSEDERRMDQQWSDGGKNSQAETDEDLEAVLQIRSWRARPVKPRIAL